MVFRIHVASLGGDSCAGVFATPSVNRLFGRGQVVVVQVGSVVFPHDCGLVERFDGRSRMMCSASLEKDCSDVK
jgi:hypothetical protein